MNSLLERVASATRQQAEISEANEFYEYKYMNVWYLLSYLLVGRERMKYEVTELNTCILLRAGGVEYRFFGRCEKVMWMMWMK